MPLPDARPCLVAAPPSPSPTFALWRRYSPHLPAHRRRRATATLRRAATGQVRRGPYAREDAPCVAPVRPPPRCVAAHPRAGVFPPARGTRPAAAQALLRPPPTHS
ncbi:hypothetical protein PVAP13_9NG175100 [Panicum virgatum]|uniref:Uncharacterized protein n=1 Tax=Panicum virgatum TaxID=38727 RepID=A0A8T0MN98_PANVG|nr:hypothetical protein PVAP13_9NG175100 [Panicum virgatum]